MKNAGELRKGDTIETEGNLLAVVDFQHNKTARSGAVVRLKLRNLRSGATFERSFPVNERFRDVELDRRTVQYQYRDDDLFHFMDTISFDQVALDAAQIGEYVNYLKEGSLVTLFVYEDQSIDVEMPVAVELRVIETERGFKGDTANAATKPAVLETGMRVLVPLFVNTDDVIRVDTRTGEYMDRVH